VLVGDRDRLAQPSPGLAPPVPERCLGR
jgi:hypothetical protein